MGYDVLFGVWFWHGDAGFGRFLLESMQGFG